MRATTILAVGFMIGLSAAGLVQAAEATQITQAAHRPNILFIEADDLMPRFMNKLGGGFGHTPNLDRLATQGTHFTNAVTQAPMCGPSRNGLLTNRYSHSLGFYRNGHMRCLPDDMWVFPPTLRAAGYQTAYIGKSHMRPRESDWKLSRDEQLRNFGFDYTKATGERYRFWKSLKDGKDISQEHFIKHLKSRGTYEQFLADNDGYGNVSTMTDDLDYLDGYSAKVATDWLTEQRDTEKPFFLWFNFCLPHGPYDTPRAYHELAATLDIPAPKSDRFGHEVPEPLLVDNSPIKSKEDIEKHRAGEAASVAFMDKMIGNLLTALEQSGELDNTVVVFFSDHSIFLGNHGRMHKGTLFEESLSGSLIVSCPQLFPSDHTIRQAVELMDLIPTAFDLAGVKDPNEVARNGQSLVPLLEGKTEGWRPYAFSEILDAQCATGQRYRYITCEGTEMLYDHKTDPWEMENVAEKYPEVTATMRRAVQQWLKDTGPIAPPKTY